MIWIICAIYFIMINYNLKTLLTEYIMQQVGIYIIQVPWMWTVLKVYVSSYSLH